MGGMGLALSGITAEKIAEIVGNVQSASGNIAAGAQQLSSSSEEMSQGSSEQAGSVEEVSASMEQMVSSIQQSADSAQQTQAISRKVLLGYKAGNFSMRHQAGCVIDAVRHKQGQASRDDHSVGF